MALRAAGLIHEICKIKAAESHAGVGLALRAAAWTAGRNVVRIKTVLIVNLAFLGVAEDVVGFLNFFELLFGSFVAGIQIGMILTGQLAIGLANLVFLRVARNA